jgi:hypothetical protein
MQRIFIFAVLFLGLAAAHAQTSAETSGTVATDPLTLPTQTVSPSSGSGLAGGGAAGGSTPSVGVGASAASSITAPATSNPQTAVQLTGETADSSSQAAKVTTRAAVGGSSSTPSSSSSASCDSSVPSTDGGSANLTDIFGSGGSSGGC